MRDIAFDPGILNKTRMISLPLSSIHNFNPLHMPSLGVMDIVADLMKQVATGDNLSQISKAVGGDEKGDLEMGRHSPHRAALGYILRGAEGWRFEAVRVQSSGNGFTIPHGPLLIERSDC